VSADVRPVAAGDLAAVLDLVAARERRTLGIAETTEARLREHAALPSFDGWVATVDGAVVGYASLDAAHQLDLVADDDTAADALLERAVGRAGERGFHTLALTAAPEDATLRAQARRAGFALDRTTLRMWRPLTGLEPPTWTNGVSLRTYTDADGPAVKALLDRAYGGWDTAYVSRPLDDWVAFMTGHDEFDPELWFLAERDGALVACALNWHEHQGRGWLKDLVVDEHDRGRGLGSALVRHGLCAYAARGADRVGLKVDDANPTGAPRLYASLGFEIDRRYERWSRRL
jgi:ribosomal protein S18 acetylase RimI-like enzyme